MYCDFFLFSNPWNVRYGGKTPLQPLDSSIQNAVQELLRHMAFDPVSDPLIDYTPSSISLPLSMFLLLCLEPAP
jgi:hypothetical protein